MERPGEHTVYGERYIFLLNLSPHMLSVCECLTCIYNWCVYKHTLGACFLGGRGGLKGVFCKRQLSEMKSAAACQLR